MEDLPSKKPEKSKKKNWELSKEAFDKLLAILDQDRERAGQKLEQIVNNQAIFFRSKGCLNPEEYAWKTIDRVAQKINEGERIEKIFSYIHSVAWNVLRECWRQQQEAPISIEPIDNPEEFQNLVIDPKKIDEDREEQKREKQKLRCRERCLRRLSIEEHKLVTEYYQVEKHDKIETRQQIAERMQISPRALRIRTHRIKAKLRKCCDDCLTLLRKD